MGSSEEQTLQAVQKILDPYIRPREEVAHIRRVLALHLDSCLKDGSATGPLALVEPSNQKTSPATGGLYKEYLDALNANMRARNEYKACAQDLGRVEESLQTASSTQDAMHHHLMAITLQKKQERLQAVHQHLDLLTQKPAASPDFLDPNEVFQYSKSLPDIPKDVVNSLTLDNFKPDTQLKDLIDQLEKHVLRTKLLLKREQELLDDVKLRSSANPNTATESAKFEALNATRNELINWIETELSKASGDSHPLQDEAQQTSFRGEPTAQHMDEKLATIKEKYTEYSSSRKALLLLVNQQPTPTIAPHGQATQPQASPSPSPIPPPSAHLLSPYLSQLLSLSHEQKALITQKSHINTSIARQLKDNSQALNHLAEESQLIPSHPMPGMARRKPGFGEGLVLPGGELDTSSHVNPWVFTADSAKISTLEAVAEKIDETQIALEGSMRTIEEMETLLGLDRQDLGARDDVQGEEGESGVSAAAAAAAADDIWLAESGSSKPSRKSVGGLRKHNESEEKSKRRRDGDIWGVLDGNLGLLGGDNEQ